MQFMEVEISQITVGKRHRQDMGNIEALAANIRERGLLMPIGVNSSLQLVHGGRRLEALRFLGIKTTTVAMLERADDALDMLKAERDENAHRKAMTASEKVALANEIIQIEAPKAAERKKSGQKPPGTAKSDLPRYDGEGSDKHSGETKRIAAKAVEMSDKTLTKGQAIVASGNAAIIDQMNQEGVEPAYRALQQAQAAEKPDDTPRDKMGLKIERSDVVAAIALGDEMRELIRKVGGIRQKVSEILNKLDVKQGTADASIRQRINQCWRELLDDLEFCAPYVAIPSALKVSQRWVDRGWLGQAQFEKLLPEQQKLWPGAKDNDHVRPSTDSAQSPTPPMV